MNKQLEDLAVEIVELQEKLEKVQQINKAEKLKCKLEKLKALLKISVAIGAVPIAGTALTTSMGWNPFKLNDEKNTAVITTEIDKEGNIKEEKEYKSAWEKGTASEDGTIYYYTKWEKTDNNNYKRTKYVYNVSPKSIDVIIDLTRTGQEITKSRMDELFNETFNKYTEYRADLTEKEINSLPYIEARIKSFDKEDIVIKKETTESHAGKEVCKIMLEVLFMVIELTILGQRHFFSLQKYDLTRKPYLNPEEEELKKKIKAKQLIFETYPYNLPDDKN